jgi:hypothetical protein
VIPDKDLKILCVEDDPGLLRSNMLHIAGSPRIAGLPEAAAPQAAEARYSPASWGAATKADAVRLLEDGFVPHLVLHDCSIPPRPGTPEDPKAGDELYAKFVMKKLKVVVLSSRAEEHQGKPPYSKDPPLAFIDKYPLDYTLVDRAVAVFREWEKGQGSGEPS